MVAKINKKDNAGVHGATGYEFQKHCAIYLLLEDYEILKDKSYLVYFEHHDDFLFCYTNESLLDAIHLYQARSEERRVGKEC